MENVSEKTKILIVDDNPNNLYSLEALLKAPEVELLGAASGEEALQLLLEHPDITVILLDVQMPGMDGFETSELIRAYPKFRDIPVLFITAVYRSDEFARRGFRAGASDYITKPVDNQILENKVNIFVNLQKQKQQLAREVEARSKAEAQVQHLNAVLQSIRAVNQLIVREKDRARLIQHACDALVEARGYQSAWIALLDDDGRATLTAEAGLGEAFAPVTRAMAAGELPICARYTLDPAGSPILEMTPDRCSACVLAHRLELGPSWIARLEHGGKVHGLLHVGFAAGIESDPREQSLLGELAADLAFALHSVEQENARWRAQEVLARRTSQLTLLNEIGGQIAAVLDVNEVLDRAAHLVQERFGFHHVGLFIRTAGGDRLVMRARAGEFASFFPPDHSAALGQGLVGWVAEHGETLLANDVDAEPRFRNPYPDRLPTRAELAVPIRIGNEIVGVLDLQSPVPNAFDPTDVATKEALADRLAVAIDNARLYSQAAQRNRELSLLNQVIAATAAASALGIEPILDVVCRELAEAIRAAHVSAALYDADRTGAEIVAEWLGEGRVSMLGEVIPATGPATRRLLERKVPLVVDKETIGEDAALLRHVASLPGPGVLLLVPLMVEGTVVGTLALDGGKRRAFSTEDVNLAWRVAEQVSGVLARARLEEQHRQLEEQFLQAQKLEAVGRLAGGIAHDFNNLLTVIHLSSRLLERQISRQDPQWDHVARIQEAGQRATNLTRQLLAFSRREIVAPRLLNLNEVVGSLDGMLRRIIGEDVDLVMDLAADLWPIKIDPSQLDQVIVNLAVNARDAMPRGGKLTLETANVVLDARYAARFLDVEPGEYVLLSVGDEGLGMDDEVKTHLFEPFFTTKEKGKGTGLGLATVHGIVKQNAGHIWVQSEPGEGTTFQIYLPHAGGESGAPAEKNSGGAAPARGSETLLLVEDDAGVRELARDILAGQGYHVLAAEDGVEALRIAGEYEGTIDLLITDVVMPHMSGRTLADEVQAIRPGLRVLYTSGYTDNAIVHHGVLAQGTHFLAKPFDVENLVDKVRSMLNTAR